MDVLRIKYIEVLSLSVEQLFYQNRICPKYKVEPSLDLEIVPTEESLSTMKRFDWLFRKDDTKGGIIILGRTMGKLGANEVLRSSLLKGDKLTFLLVLKRPNLFNFNDLTFLTKDQIYYFSNKISDGGAPRHNLHLSIDPIGVTGINDIKKKATTLFRYHHGAHVAIGSEKVRHVLTGAEVVAKSLINQSGQADLIYDLSVLPTGLCELIVNNVVTDEFYYLGTNSNPLFGVVELVLDPSLPANYRILETPNTIIPEKPSFKILINNRPTYWRYTIKLQANSPLYLEIASLSPSDKTDFLNRLNIVSNDTSILFHKLSASETDFVFVSDNPIVFQEAYFSSSSLTNEILSISLKKYIGNITKEAVVKTDLPFPTTSLINTTSLPTIYSDTFITI